jgi:hypothetical protein
VALKKLPGVEVSSDTGPRENAQVSSGTEANRRVLNGNPVLRDQHRTRAPLKRARAA